MRAVVQRVHRAMVVVDGETVGRIDSGLLVYIGVGVDDDKSDAETIAEKIRYLRIFPDNQKPMNRDVAEASGGVLMISAFSTQADARKGRRPALTGAAEPDVARQLFDHCHDHLCGLVLGLGVTVATGRFREHMDVSSVNNGPICVLIDSKKQF